ncbi:phosphoribosylformylglycinamidine cyclo-ligase [Citrus sinensis]|uniref:Phosphoribosylformylglycinamidine cyclo-ligase n=1 Tax=Citrus sinensis TaxID=2711 RepID=A0ACB8N4X4_CITSI|nr:phosphoribosylformylglycinamidine cyclo-ligase [Citrus sinensis]
MSTSIAANTELSHCFASLINYFPNKPNPTNYVLLNCAYECKILFLSIASKGGVTYKDAWVDIDVGSKLLRRIAKMAPRIEAFGGLFPLDNHLILIICDSYLVAGTDGVGTKLKLVAMNVNDIVTFGAKPLFFLDYFATIINGTVRGCQLSDCALLGGKTAEMCDFYVATEYDLSGFAIGIVKKDSVINGKNILVGDVLIGLLVLALSGLLLNIQVPSENTSLDKASNILVKKVLDIISKGGVKGILHIVGSGFTDNILWVFPKGLGVVLVVSKEASRKILERGHRAYTPITLVRL